jgi:predicted amino acid racemase
MVAPRLKIDLDKLTHNARQLRALYGSQGIRVTAVTKCVCGSPDVARALLRGGIRSLGDSRLANIQRMRAAGLDAQFVLIRSPMLSQVEQVVEWADISLNTELSVICQLGECAARRGIVHGVVLMVELGDLREGIMPSDIEPTVEQILNMKGIELIGIGTNLACFGAIRPTQAKMQELTAIAHRIQYKYGLKLEIVSGGNSANYQWFVSTPDVGLVNHLRIGESILLGCDPLTREPIPCLYADAFALWAEVIELKTKPPKPYGEVAQDAFGHTPTFEGNGYRHRAILALGRQDVDVSAVRPRVGAHVLGASSDHLVLGVEGADLAVGTQVQFDVQYSALLRAMTSPFVEKAYAGRSVSDARWRAPRSRPRGWERRKHEYTLPGPRIQEPVGLIDPLAPQPPC